MFTRTQLPLKYPNTTQMLTDHPYISIRIQVPAAAGRLPAEARAERVLLPRRRAAIDWRGRTLKAGAGKFIYFNSRMVWATRLTSPILFTARRGRVVVR